MIDDPDGPERAADVGQLLKEIVSHDEPILARWTAVSDQPIGSVLSRS